MRYHLYPIPLAIALSMLASAAARAQTADSTFGFFPLAIGNRWEYLHQDDPSSNVRERWFEITGDTVTSNGMRYFILREGDIAAYLRYDSTNHSITTFIPAVEKEYPSLPSSSSIKDERFSDTLFGATIQTWRVWTGLSSWTDYGYGIGMYSYHYQTIDQFNHYGRLVYARIDGREYGTKVSAADPARLPGKLHLY